MMKNTTYLPGSHPWQNHILYFDHLPSTNDHAKLLAKKGAPEGTVVIAGAQSAGRGRMGRSFHAPEGLGLYLSLILRPDCRPEALMHLTCAAGVAACNAVERCAGLRPGIKWINDLMLQNKKLGGILTELSIDSKTGLVDWAVVGIGINCLHQTFPPDIRELAISLLKAGCPVSPAALGSALIQALYEMNQQLLDQESLMAVYKKDCLTIGQDVLLIQGSEKTAVTVLDIDRNGGLVVRYRDGRQTTVYSGEVSVRGQWGYL